VNGDRSHPDYGERWHVLAKVDAYDKASNDPDSTERYYSDAATVVVPNGAGHRKAIADFLRGMADEIEAGDLPPEPQARRDEQRCP
jgi:hypothetical protein